MASRSFIIDFLQNQLASGPVPVSELEGLARAHQLLNERQSITDSKPFKGAKKVLGIRSIRIGFGCDGEWAWTMPTATPIHEPPKQPEPTPPVIYDEGSCDVSSVSIEDVRAVLDAVPIDRRVAPEHTSTVIYGAVQSDAQQMLSARVRDEVGPDGLLSDLHDAGHGPEIWRRGVVLLHRRHRPTDIPPVRWQQFLGDCVNFLTGLEAWARRAADLGWDALALFGCSRANPLGHLEVAGLVWAINGGRLVRLHADWAEIERPDGERRAYHRRRIDPTRVILPLHLP